MKQLYNHAFYLGLNFQLIGTIHENARFSLLLYDMLNM